MSLIITRGLGIENPTGIHLIPTRGFGFIPEEEIEALLEELFDGPDPGKAFTAPIPKIGSSKILSEAPLVSTSRSLVGTVRGPSPKISSSKILSAAPVPIPRSSVGTVMGAIPKISSSEILTEVSTPSASSSAAGTVVGAAPKIGSSKILSPTSEESKSSTGTIVKPRPKISGIRIIKKK